MTVLHLIPESPVRQILRWRVDVMRSRNGTERRVSSSKHPRQTLVYSYFLDEAQTAEWRSTIRGIRHQQVEVPLWFLQGRGSGDAEATTVTGDVSRFPPMAESAHKAILTDGTDHEVIEYTAIGSGSLTLSSGLESSWSGATLAPLWPARLRNTATLARHPIGGAVLALELDIEPQWPLATAAASDTHDGRPLVTDLPLVRGQLSRGFDADVRRVDFGAKFEQFSSLDLAAETYQLDYNTRDIVEWLALLEEVGGPLERLFVTMWDSEKLGVRIEPRPVQIEHHPRHSVVSLGVRAAEEPEAPVNYAGELTDFDAGLGGSFKWSGAARGSDGKIYCAPLDATDVLVIDPSEGSAVRDDFGLSMSGSFSFKYRGIVAGADGRLYCVPMNATEVLVVDPSSGTASLEDFGLDLSGTSKWRGGVLASNGKIYCVPNNADDVLVIDTSSSPVTASLESFGDVPKNSSGSWHGAAEASDGKIYCAPYPASDGVLILDPSDHTASLNTFGMSFSTDSSYAGVAEASDGKLYCPPATSGTPDVLVINPQSGTAEKQSFGLDLSGKTWAGAATGADGGAYFTPSGADHVLVVDPSGGSAALNDFGLDLSGSSKWNGDAALDGSGAIYFAPHNADNVLVLSP